VPPPPLLEEISEEEKQAVIRRDGEHCLCFGTQRTSQVALILRR